MRQLKFLKLLFLTALPIGLYALIVVVRQPGLDQALEQAAISGDKVQARALIRRGANVNSTRFKPPNTILMSTLRNWQKDMIPVLEAAGVHKTPTEALLVAAFLGRTHEVQQLLAAGVSAAVADTDGDTALSYAVVEGHVTVIKTLIAAGADVNHKSEDGMTSLDWAKDGQQQQAVRLLKEAGAKE